MVYFELRVHNIQVTNAKDPNRGLERTDARTVAGSPLITLKTFEEEKLKVFKIEGLPSRGL